MKIRADLDLCQGHRVCLGEDQEVFGFNEAEDHVVVLLDHVGEDRRAAVTAAVKYCPAFALSVEEDR